MPIFDILVIIIMLLILTFIGLCFHFKWKMIEIDRKYAKMSKNMTENKNLHLMCMKETIYIRFRGRLPARLSWIQPVTIPISKN